MLTPYKEIRLWEATMKIGKLDWIVYRLFFWRWNKILMENPSMAKKMGVRIMMFSQREDTTK